MTNVPSPSWPEVFEPQQYAAPAPVNAHTDVIPELIEANERPPDTSTGVGCDSTSELPIPIVPTELSPQQYAAPPARAQMLEPAESAENTCPPVTAAGTGWAAASAVPVPKLPTVFSPQQ